MPTMLGRRGATSGETAAPLPGDDLVADATYVATHAIMIDADADEVWPWLVQLGQGRGGLYSYDWLENAAGLDVHSADRVLPEHQHLAVGDAVRLTPPGREPALVLRAASVVPGEHLTLVWRSADGHDEWSWAFVLQGLAGGSCRLSIRVRARFETAAPGPLAGRALAVAHRIMEGRMLRGIRARAERRPDRRRLHGVRSLPTAVHLLASGRIHLVQQWCGQPLRMPDGRTYVPFRHTISTAPVEPRDGGPAVLQARFHLRGFRPGRRWRHAAFRRLCIVTTPFFVGLPGFRSKLWMVDDATGDFAGLNDWDDATGARAFAAGLVRILRPLSVRNSVSWEVTDGQTVAEHLARHGNPPSGPRSLRSGSSARRSRRAGGASWASRADGPPRPEARS